MADVLSALVTWSLIIGGALSLAVGLCFFVGTLRFLRRAVPLPGRVTGYEARQGVDSEGFHCVYYHPTLEFEDESGQSHRVTVSFGSSERSYEAGAPVLVLFDPATPAQPRIRSFHHLWFFPIIFTVLGTAGLTGGLAFGFLFDLP